MTSKTLFFKFLKKDLGHRLWAIALIGLGCFFAYPVVAAMEAGQIDTFATVEEGVRYYNDSMLHMHTFGNGLTVFITMVSALVCGMSSFSYLNSRNKVDFYHSLPIRRELMFGASFLGGILIMAVPFILSVVASAFIAVGNGADGSALWPVVWSGLGLHLIYFILMYATVVLAMVMTGNLVVAFLGYMVFCSVVPLAVAFSQGYFLIFFDTFMTDSCRELIQNATRISPVMEYFYAVENYVKGDSVQMIRAAGTLAVSGVLAFISCFLYRKRPSEAAGKAMAFEVSKPIVRVILVLLFSMGMSLLFWGLQESLGWAVFGAVCGAVIAHCIIEVIYHFDFKKLFSHPLQMAGCAAASLLILFSFYFDWFGYDAYLPEASKVASASVDMGYLSQWVSHGGTVKREDGAYIWQYPEEGGPLYKGQITDIDTVLQLAEAGIGDIDAERADDSQFEWVNIAYTMKNGKRVFRSYYMNIDKNRALLQKIYENKQFQQAMFPIMERTADSVAEAGYRRGGGQEEIRLEDLTAEEYGQLLKTYQEEFGALTLEQMQQEAPVGLIRFYSALDLEGISWWNREEAKGFPEHLDLRWSNQYEISDQDFYPVYPSFKKTVALLESHGIQAGDYYDTVSLGSVRIMQHEREGSWKQIKVTAPEELEALKKVLTIPGMAYYNPLLENEAVDLDIYVTGEEENQFSVTIPKGKLPEFAEQRLLETEAEAW